MADEREKGEQRTQGDKRQEGDQSVGGSASPHSKEGNRRDTRQFADETDSRPRGGHDGDPATTPPDQHTRAGDEVDRTGAASVGADGRVDQVGDEEDEVEVQAEVVEAVAERVADRLIQETLTVHQSWNAPIPPAAELQAIDAVVPGGAERILRMAEDSLAAQIEVDTTLAHGDVAAVRRGQYLSTSIVGVSLAIALTLALLGAPWGVVAVFVTPSLFQFSTSLVRAIRERSDNGATAEEE
ncbi:DUF2335 domain-containing protein [Mycolicibacterium stellerae]|uniref:DUF2335 domain-containing protein n=1 Tax=Mycolicibacterium stellerae TaxID=2358193 RepID=UPI0013DE3746|nr:DUF2335 domain-containing protein [Mycolicibacterium stellerae]